MVVARKIHSVLIVDDDPDDRLIAKARLERSGRYDNIFTAADGKQALAIYEQYEKKASAAPDMYPPLVILLDVNMPTMSGFELLEAIERLKSRWSPVVVMLTASEAQADRVRSKDFGCVEDYLVKPINASTAVALAERFGE